MILTAGLTHITLDDLLRNDPERRQQPRQKCESKIDPGVDFGCSLEKADCFVR